jgi:hypothetical protein
MHFIFKLKTNQIAILWIILGSGYTFANLDLGVRAQSFGGAFRAVASSNDIIFYNPSGILKDRRIASDLDYRITFDKNYHEVTVSVVDSKTTAWGLGLAYSGGIIPKSNTAISHLVYLAMAIPIITETFSLGTSFSYDYHESKTGDLFKHFFNMDVSLMIRAPMGVSFAIVMDHILKPKGNEKPMGLSLAASFELGKIISTMPLIFSFDWLMDDVTSKNNLQHILGGGAEYMAFSFLPLRLGIKSKLEDDSHTLSIGSGMIFNSFALDALYQQNLVIGKKRHFGIAWRMKF